MRRLVLFAFLIFSQCEAKLVLYIPEVRVPDGNYYFGSSEQDYLVKGDGGRIDDGIFVAIKDGGSYEGYSYYELPFPYTGAVDGTQHASLPKSGFDNLPASGYIGTSGPITPKRHTLPQILRGSIIPKGSKFFHWVSGKGDFHIPESYMNPVQTEAVIIRSKAVPKAGFEMWYDESDVVEEILKKIL